MKSNATIARSQGDVPALSAGVIAVLISIWFSPDAYDVLNFCIGLTMTSVILAYEGRSSRDLLQTIAFSMSVAVSTMPIVAFVDEALRSNAPLRYLVGLYAWDCVENPCIEHHSDSRVENIDLVVGWIVLAVVFAFVDRSYQSRLENRG